MYFMNTEMHMVTFCITVFELVMLVLQIIYFLQRPSDTRRLQYLILLVCLILHNICSGLFPDEQIPIPFQIQIIIAYLVGFAMSMYVVYYFYKVFELKHLKFFATYGLIFFLFLPFVFLFVVPYLLTGDERLSSKLTVIIPFFYGLGFMYSTARGLYEKFKTHDSKARKGADLYEHAVIVYISMVCWASLPVIVFFGDFQVLEHTVTNSGFLMMTIIYVRSAIKQSRVEYQQLIDSEQNLQDLNKVLKKKVKHRTRKLQRLLEEREIILISLAHETKTPLTLINNYLNDYIQAHGNSPEMRIIKTNINSLTTDITNFFDVESYEKGFNVYDHNQISNFTSILSSKLVLFQSEAKRKGIQVDYASPTVLYLKAHPGSIERIINNLLENAIKYTAAGGRVLVRLFESNERIIFSVKDDGVGIPLSMQKKVFDPYFKLSVNGQSNGGMGMGLFIVNKIVKDLAGEIFLESELESGTEVKINLPSYTPSGDDNYVGFVPEEIKFEYTLPIEDHIGNPGNPYILIVEDNTAMLAYLLSKLESKYNLLVARSGSEALRRMRDATSLDLILSDIMMNDMDGFELCTAVSSNEQYAHIPFVFLTAKVTAADKAKGLALGAIDYIEKPFSIDQLISKIDSIQSTLKRQRTAVINQAYKTILPGNNLNSGMTLDMVKSGFVNAGKRYHLTSREIEIIQLMVKGQPYKLIGDSLHISDKTVAKHISNIFSKVSVNNKVELINKLEASDLLP